MRVFTTIDDDAKLSRGFASERTGIGYIPTKKSARDAKQYDTVVHSTQFDTVGDGNAILGGSLPSVSLTTVLLSQPVQ